MFKYSGFTQHQRPWKWELIMAFSLLERSVFIITSWGAHALWRTWYPALCVLHRRSLSWKPGKLPVLGRESCSCSACSYLGRATILCRSSKEQQSGVTPELLPLINPQEALQLLGCLGNFGERENLASSTPCKTQAATEPVFPSVQAGLPSPSQSRTAGWKEKIPPVSWERWLQDPGCWKTASPGEFRFNWSQETPRQQTFQSGTSPFVNLRGTAAAPAVLTCKNKLLPWAGTPTAPISYKNQDCTSVRFSSSWLLAPAEIKTIPDFSPSTSSSGSFSQNLSQQRCSEQKRKHSENTLQGWFFY